MAYDVWSWYADIWNNHVLQNWFWIFGIAFVLGVAYLVFDVLVIEVSAPNEVPIALFAILIGSVVCSLFWPALLPLGLIWGFVAGLQKALETGLKAKKKRREREKRLARMAAAKARREPVVQNVELIEPTSDEDMFCSCPKCGMAGLHEIRPTDTGRVRRDCTFCTWVWFTGTPRPKEIPAGDDRWGD